MTLPSPNEYEEALDAIKSDDYQIWRPREDSKRFTVRIIHQETVFRALRLAARLERPVSYLMAEAGCEGAPDTNSGCFGYDDAEAVFLRMLSVARREAEEG